MNTSCMHGLRACTSKHKWMLMFGQHGKTIASGIKVFPRWPLALGHSNLAVRCKDLLVLTADHKALGVGASASRQLQLPRSSRFPPNSNLAVSEHSGDSVSLCDISLLQRTNQLEDDEVCSAVPLVAATTTTTAEPSLNTSVLDYQELYQHSFPLSSASHGHEQCCAPGLSACAGFAHTATLQSSVPWRSTLDLSAGPAKFTAVNNQQDKNMEEIGMKTCSVCKEHKAPSQMAPDPRRTDGLDSRCRACRNKQQAANRRANQQRHAALSLQAELGSPSMQECRRCKQVKSAFEFVLRNGSAPCSRGQTEQPFCRDCSSQQRKVVGKVSKPTIDSKQCQICKLVKKAEDFTKDSGKRTGLGSRCRECENKYRRDRRKLRNEGVLPPLRSARGQARLSNAGGPADSEDATAAVAAVPLLMPQLHHMAHMDLSVVVQPPFPSDAGSPTSFMEAGISLARAMPPMARTSASGAPDAGSGMVPVMAGPQSQLQAPLPAAPWPAAAPLLTDADTGADAPTASVGTSRGWLVSTEGPATRTPSPFAAASAALGEFAPPPPATASIPAVPAAAAVAAHPAPHAPTLAAATMLPMVPQSSMQAAYEAFARSESLLPWPNCAELGLPGVMDDELRALGLPPLMRAGHFEPEQDQQQLPLPLPVPVSLRTTGCGAGSSRNVVARRVSVLSTYSSDAATSSASTAAGVSSDDDDDYFTSALPLTAASQPQQQQQPTWGQTGAGWQHDDDMLGVGDGELQPLDFMVSKASLERLQLDRAIEDAMPGVMQLPQSLLLAPKP